MKKVKGTRVASRVPINRRDFLKNTTAFFATAALAQPAYASGSEDRIVVNGLDCSHLDENLLADIRAGGVHCVHLSVLPFGDEKYARSFMEFIDSHKDQVTLAFTVRDIRQAAAEGKISVFLGAQGSFHYLNEEFSENESMSSYTPMVEKLRREYDIGLRIQGITYNVTHFFGGGSLDNNVPITTAGRRFVEEIHKLNILLDVGGHVGERTSLDAIEMSQGIPVVATHTNVEALNAHFRADSDKLFEAIAKTGGVIGLNAISDYHVRNPSNHQQHGGVSPQASLDLYLDQFDYLKRLVGVDHIGAGPDFVVGIDADHTHRDNFAFPDATLSTGPLRMVKGFESNRDFPNLTSGLQSRGWTQQELDKVLGGNWLRVYEQVWDA